MAPPGLLFSYKISGLLIIRPHKTQHRHNDTCRSVLGTSSCSPGSRLMWPVFIVASLLCSCRHDTVGLNAILVEFFSCSKMPN